MRFTKGVVVLVGVIALVVFVARLSFHKAGSKHLAAETARLDAAEPGWRQQAIAEARLRSAPPADLNSANVVLDVHAALPPVWSEHQQNQSRPWGPVTNRQPAFGKLVWMLQAMSTTEPLCDSAEQKLLRRELLAQPGGYYPITIPDNPYLMLLPHIQKAREVAQLLEYDARIAALQNRPDRGIQGARATLVVGRSIGDEPFFLSQLVRMKCGAAAAQSAMQVLAWSEPKEGLAELQAELRAEADFPWFLSGLKGERASLNQLFEGVESGKITYDSVINTMNDCGIQRPGIFSHFGLRLYKAFLPGDLAKSLELFSRYAEVAKLPPHEQLEELARIPLPPRPPEDFRYLITNLLLPAYQNVAEAAIRTRAELLTASTAIACERFRLARGRWPESLEEIPKELLPEVPTDPYSGKPIRYRRLEDGVIVYTVGLEKERRHRLPPGEKAPGPLANLGPGHQLWNPALRGTPSVLPSPLPALEQLSP